MAKRTTPVGSTKDTTRRSNSVDDGASRPATSHDASKPKTKTLPESMRGATCDGPDVVTALKVYGMDVLFELRRDKKTFTLGSDPGHDIVIPDGYLSGLHCMLERRGLALRVRDQESYNGTFIDGRRESVFDLRPGATFSAGAIRFLALNDEMVAAYPVLADLLGSTEEAGLYRP